MKATTSKTWFLLTLMGIIVLTGCKKQALEPPFTALAEEKLSGICCLTRPLFISPANGPVTTLVTLSNIDFGTNPGVVRVTFNGVEAPIVTFSSTRIVAEVPSKAGTGPVKVTVNNYIAIGPIFTYKWLTTVSSFAIPNGRIPEQLTINGSVMWFTTTNSEIWKASRLYDLPEFEKIAGNGAGFLDGVASSAKFRSPIGIDYKNSYGLIIGDNLNHRIRRIDLFTPHQAFTAAGAGSRGFLDGNAATARFDSPNCVAVDHLDNIYVADMANNRIRKITPSGIVSTLAGSGVAGYANGSGTMAQFNHPRGIAVDASGNVFVADALNNRIRKINPSGLVTTFAGDGLASYQDGMADTAHFNKPFGLALDIANNLYVADTENHRIRKITPTRFVSTVAGNGAPGTVDGDGRTTQFRYPSGVDIESNGNIWVAGKDGGKLRKITIL